MFTDAVRLLDHPLIAERYFFPRCAPVPDAFEVDVRGARLRCFRSAPCRGAPTVLVFHGTGESVADWVNLVVGAWNRRGINVVLSEYRGFGGSTGYPALAGMLDDALVVADNVGTQRLFVYGRSVGSLYAVHVAAKRPIAGLILESGISDVYREVAQCVLPEELGVDEATLRAAVDTCFDQRAKLARMNAPVLVLHALGDELVPVHQAYALSEWAGPKCATLRVFEQGDHNSIHMFNGEQILEEVARMCQSARGSSL